MFKLSYSTNGLTKLDLFQAITNVKNAGYDGVELSFQYGQFDPFALSPNDLSKIKYFFEKNIISPVCISTASTFFLSKTAHEPSLLNLNAEKRTQRINLIKKGIDIAKTIGAPIVSFQSGYLRAEHSESSSIDLQELLVNGINNCLQTIGNIILVIEPEPGMYIETIDDAISLINIVNSPNFRLHLDICHAYCTEVDYIKSIVNAEKYIEYMHLADIKEGYKLKFISVHEYIEIAGNINLNSSGYLVYIEKSDEFVLLTKESGGFVFFNGDRNRIKSGDEQILESIFIDNNKHINFIPIQIVKNAIINNDIILETKAYLDSVAGIKYEIIEKSVPILRYIRNQESASPIITKPICNTIKGKVHYHEFPGKGEIDFNAVFIALETIKYSGYVTVELYNHSEVWEEVLPKSRKYLTTFMPNYGSSTLDLPNTELDYNHIEEIDHRYVNAPYVRLAKHNRGVNGDHVFLYDLRFTQPNTDYLEADVLHSLEHFLLVGFMKYKGHSFINVGPMGCHTGFYLILLNESSPSSVAETLVIILKTILSSSEVPLNDNISCGRAGYHNLEGAKQIAKKILTLKQDWLKFN